MDNKAFYNLSYGVFVLGSRSKTQADSSPARINACITNTCFQTASDPARLAISVIKKNLTCSLIEESRVFSLSVLDKTCSFELIKHFGYQSGRDVDKFADFAHKLDANGCPYITESVNSVFTCRVTEMLDLGSHMLFVGEVIDAVVIGDKEPLTYADYHANVRTQAAQKKDENAGKKIVGWRCKICGFIHDEPELPEDFTCPLCGHPAEDFEPIYEE